MSGAKKSKAEARFKEVRRRMREQERERNEWGYYEEQRGNCGPDVVPPRGVRVFGWCFLLVFFFGAMIFFGLRVNWFAPIGLILCVCVCLLPSTIEFLCRGNRVLKRDRSNFFFWW